MRSLTVDAQIWSSRPSVKDGFGYLYVLAFNTDVVKIGKTTDPAARMSQHISDASAYRVNLTDVWFSEAHPGYAANESTVLAHVAACHRGARVRREYFYGIDFQETVDLVEQACRGEEILDQRQLPDLVVDLPEYGTAPTSIFSLRRLPAYKTLANSLETEIRSGTIGPGTTLPSIASLQAQHDVSVNIVRRALTELAMLGLIETHQGVGSFVVDELPKADQESTSTQILQAVAEMQAQMASLGRRLDVLDALVA